MRILFVGVLDVEWSTNVAMARALESLGHEVEAFNYRTEVRSSEFDDDRERLLIDKAASFFRRWPSLPWIRSWYFRRAGRDFMNRKLRRRIREGGFDLLLLAKTDTVDYRVLESVRDVAPSWYFFMDPMDEARRMHAAGYAQRATWASATFSDVVRHFRRAGARAHWIMQGIRPEIFWPGKEDAKEFDVTFAGSKTDKRNRMIDALENAGMSVHCVGSGWENPPIYLEELADLYRRSRVVLNFCRSGAGFSVRVFQVLGTGSFLLSEYCPDLEAVFDRRRHLDWFQDTSELVTRIRYYLEQPDDREEIAQKGAEKVATQHTWRDVMARIIKVAKTGGSARDRRPAS